MPPKLEQLMSECEETEHWVELGAAMHIPQSELDSIEHSHGEDPARCRRELFKVCVCAHVRACVYSLYNVFY